MSLPSKLTRAGGTLAVVAAIMCAAAERASAQCVQRPCKPPPEPPPPSMVYIAGTQNGYTYSTYSPGGSNTGNTGEGGFILGSPASEPPVTFTASAINQTVPFQIRVVAEDVLSCWNGSGGVDWGEVTSYHDSQWVSGSGHASIGMSYQPNLTCPAGQYPADSQQIAYTQKTTSTGSIITPTVTFDSNNLLQ